MAGGHQGGEPLRLFPVCNESVWFLRLAWAGWSPLGRDAAPLPGRFSLLSTGCRPYSWPLCFLRGTYFPVLPLAAFSRTSRVGGLEESQGCSCALLPQTGGVVQTGSAERHLFQKGSSSGSRAATQLASASAVS